MNRTCTVFLRDAYFAPKKFVNVLGQRFLFVEGVCRDVPVDAAEFLLRKRIASSVIENEGFVEPEVVVETEFFVVSEPEPVVEYAPELEPEPVAEYVLETEVVTLDESEVLETSTDFTREFIEELYERLGTWSAVSSELGVSASDLKRIRDELGL